MTPLPCARLSDDKHLPRSSGLIPAIFQKKSFRADMSRWQTLPLVLLYVSATVPKKLHIFISVCFPVLYLCIKQALTTNILSPETSRYVTRMIETTAFSVDVTEVLQVQTASLSQRICLLNTFSFSLGDNISMKTCRKKVLCSHTLRE